LGGFVVVVAVSYLAAYGVNLYVKDLKWNLDQGFEWMGADPNEEENLNDKDEKTKTDEDKVPNPTQDTTPRRKLERLAEPEKRWLVVKKILASRSRRYQPRVGRVGGSRTPDEYEASGSMEQAAWWVNNVTRKLIWMEGTMNEVARLLSCSPASI
jgi:hypothetical protein